MTIVSKSLPRPAVGRALLCNDLTWWTIIPPAGYHIVGNTEISALLFSRYLPSSVGACHSDRLAAHLPLKKGSMAVGLDSYGDRCARCVIREVDWQSSLQH